jgi:hypothetical protein
MARIWILAGALALGGLLGGLLTYRPDAIAAGDPTERGTKEICSAIVTRDGEKWKQLYQRYLRTDDVRKPLSPTAEALVTARTLTPLFHAGDPVGKPRRAADGTSGARTLRAVECAIGPEDRIRTVTVHWQRQPGERWRPYAVVVAARTTDITETYGARPVVAGEEPDAQGLATSENPTPGPSKAEWEIVPPPNSLGTEEDVQRAQAAVQAEVDRSKRRPAAVAAELERVERGY